MREAPTLPHGSFLEGHRAGVIYSRRRASQWVFDLAKQGLQITMARPKQNVSKSEIARELGVSRSRVSQLITAGMPVQADGRINLDKAIAWYHNNVQPRMKPAPRKDAPPKTKSPAPAVSPDEGIAYRDLFERLISQADKVPEILAALGVHDAATLVAAPDIFVELIFGLAGPLVNVAYNFDGGDDRGDVPEADVTGLARRYRFAFDPAAIRMDFSTETPSAAEALLGRFDEALAALPD